MHPAFSEKRAELVEQVVMVITQTIDDFTEENPLSGVEVIGAIGYFKWNYFCLEGESQHD